MNSRFLPLMILTTSLFAQGPGGPRHMMMQAQTDQAQSYLNLTDSQVQALQQLRQSENFPWSVHLLGFEQIALNGSGDTDTAVARQNLSEFVVHHRAEHLLALAAAEHPVAFNPGKHVFDHLGEELRLEILGRPFGLGDGLRRQGRLHLLHRLERRVHRRIHQSGARGHRYIT